MMPERPRDFVYKDIRLEPEWCQDLFSWIYPISTNCIDSDLHAAELIRFFEDQYLTQHGTSISLSFVSERDIESTGNVGYIRCLTN